MIEVRRHARPYFWGTKCGTRYRNRTFYTVKARKLAEREGFEPPCPLRDKTLSRRPRYDHFGTSPHGRTAKARTNNYISPTRVVQPPTDRPPTTYGVHPCGIANRWTCYIGRDGKILAIDKTVRPETSAEDMAAKLKSWGAPGRTRWQDCRLGGDPPIPPNRCFARSSSS